MNNARQLEILVTNFPRKLFELCVQMENLEWIKGLLKTSMEKLSKKVPYKITEKPWQIISTINLPSFRQQRHSRDRYSKIIHKNSA